MRFPLFWLVPMFTAIVCFSRGQTEASLIPTNGALTDCSWDVYLSSLPAEKRFNTMRRAYGKTPSDPSIKAHYAQYLVFGKAWNGPEGRVAEGLALLEEAAGEDNTTANLVLGLSKAYGIGSDKDLSDAGYYIQRAARAGNVTAMIVLGEATFKEQTLGSEVSTTEFWYRLAAKRGVPDRLYTLALAYEKNRDSKAISIPKAAALMHEAACYGSLDALKRMQQTFKQKDASPEMRRAACLTYLWYGALGSNSLQGPRVKQAAVELETLYPEDPVVLVALGRMYRSREFFMLDLDKAYAFFEKAASLGSDDGLCERATMQAEGLGVPADPTAALAIWRELEKKGHPGSLAALGYYSYWGSFKSDGLPKDEKAAYGYSRLAAAAGDPFGQHNVTLCFSHGVGTEKNYLLAVLYSHAAANRGYKHDRKELPKLITAAFD